MQTFVIVGAGMAGGKAVEALRDAGFRRPRRPAGRRGRAPLRAPAAEQGLPARRGRARRRVPAEGRRPGTSSTRSSCAPRRRSRRSTSPPARSCWPAASACDYDALLLATGARARAARRSPAPISTASTSCVRWRTPTACAPCSTPADGSSSSARDGSAARSPPPRASAAWRWRMVETQSVPLEGVLGRELGAFYRDVHAEHGVGAAPGQRRRGDRGRRARRARAHQRRRRPGCRRGAARGRRRPAHRAGRGRAEGRQRDRRRRLAARERRGRLRGRRHGQPRASAASGRLRVEHWANALEQGPSAARACSARTSSTSGSRTSSPTSTTSGWSTRATAGPATRSSSAATWRRASSSPSGCATGASRRV